MVRSTHFLAAALALLVIPSLAAAQQSDDEWLRNCQERRESRDLERFCDVRVTRIAATGGPVRVEPGTNGGVSVEAWTGSGIEIHARIDARARTQAAARALWEDVRVNTSGTIGASGPANDNDANWHVNFVVYVPASSDLDLSTNNGPLSVRGVTGSMNLETRNGPLSLREVGGDVYARTQNGPLSVNLSGTSWRGRGLDAETRNGPIHLVVPDGFNAQLEAGTDNGPFVSDFPLTVTLQGRMRGPISATLGRGGPPVRVVTTNGPVSINRR